MNTVVIGGGAAGMMAAIQSAANGEDVILFEKNEKLGKKLFITGKGRCNLTNACDMEDLFSHIISNSKFMYSAFYQFSNRDTMDYFESLGLRIKTERGARVFPISDKSSDVIKVLADECRRQKVRIMLNTAVQDVLVQDGSIKGVRLSSGKVADAEKVILATGGKSYPSTGSTGDGYHMAEALGHTVTRLRPGLTGMHTKEDAPSKMQGLTLKNVAIRLTGSGRKKSLYDGFGEVLFTHYGVSGPLILSASSQVGDRLEAETITLHIDLKPALTELQLDKRILHDLDESPNQSLKNALVHLLPKSMIPVLIEKAGLSPDLKVNQITREQRREILNNIKDFSLTLTGLRDWNEAIITRGGIKTAEVDPSSMESKLVKGLFFAGEILDVDALTGGFNLQVAWSTGYAAGNAQKL